MSQQRGFVTNMLQVETNPLMKHVHEFFVYGCFRNKPIEFFNSGFFI